MMNDSRHSLETLIKRAEAIRLKYDKLNEASGRDKWNNVDYAAGFVGDVGDLIKLIMAKENKRVKDNVDSKLKHELGDCLWSLLVIANNYGIDLEDAFHDTMNELEGRLLM